LANEVGQTGVAQHVRRQVKPGVAGDAADRSVRRARRDPRALHAQEQRGLAVDGATLALRDPFLEDGADERVQRDLPVRITFP
jgi:hypothetical protein